jgi:ABC-2 type transport system permease protein
MNKTFLVLRNEMVTVLRSKSFLFVTFALPLFGVLIFLGVSLLKGDAAESPTVSTVSSESDEYEVEGYVDEGGLVQALHPDVPEGILVPYPDEASAHKALNSGQISAYYIIPADYLESGDLVYINPAYRVASDSGQSWMMRQTIFANLLGNDAERLARASQPMDVQVNALAPESVRNLDNPLTFFLPYGSMMILYLVLMMSASLLLNSVGNEKKNQVIEILLSSVTPRQMLTGKILGLGLLGLLQTVIWVGTAYTLLRVSGRTFNLPAGFQLPASIIAWEIVFFLLGYTVYASLMAGLGALVPNLREASQAVIVVIWPLLLPMFFIISLIEHTHDALAIAFSLFPLTAPVAMVARLAAGGVPWWQPCLSAALLLTTAFFVVRAVAGLFHAQTLLSGQPFSVRQFYRALFLAKPIK